MPMNQRQIVLKDNWVGTKGTWFEAVAGWMNRVSKIINGTHFISGGELILTEGGFILRGKGGGTAASDGPWSFDTSITQGNADTPTEGRVTISAGTIFWHGSSSGLHGTPIIGTNYTGDGTVPALVANYNVIYVYINWASAPTISSGVTTSTGVSESAAYPEDGTDEIRFPLCCVQYNTTTKQVTLTRRYWRGDIHIPGMWGYPA